MNPFLGMAHDPVLQQHLNNIAKASQGQLTPTQKSEIKGEKEASEHMSGKQFPATCLCKDDPYTLHQKRQAIIQNTPPEYRFALPSNICMVCQYFQPQPGEFRMVKGWSGGGTGIDQIWVKPANWTPQSNVCPEEIRIVEAKGGEGSDLSTLPTYIGDYGPDGFPLEQGCIQMSREWVYVDCEKTAQSAEPNSELAYVAALVRNRLAGLWPCPNVTGIAIKNGAPMSKQDMPLLSQPHAQSNGMFVYDPVLRTETIRDQLLVLLNNPSTQEKEVVDACKPALDALEEAGKAKKELQAYFQYLDDLTKGLAKQTNPGPLQNHLLNVLQEFHKQIDRKQALVDHKLNQFLKQYDANGKIKNDPGKLAQVVAKCEKDAYTQIYKNLNEISGELLAAQEMLKKPGFVMLKGWSGGGTGIDQVWLRSPGNPNATLEQLLADPIPKDLEVVIVEAKGGSAKLNPNAVYVGEQLQNGTVLNNGCKQMDQNWVSVHATKMINEASDSPYKKVTGELILYGIQHGNPKVRGVGISNGQAMSDNDYSHLGVTKTNDVNGLPGNIIKYGP